MFMLIQLKACRSGQTLVLDEQGVAWGVVDVPGVH